MNQVDFLLYTKFSSLSFEQKLEIKKLGPHHPQQFELINTNMSTTQKQKSNRFFNHEWFKKKDWLTGSVIKKTLFCFPCLLFGGDSVWTKSGYKDLKHLSTAASKHELSTIHFDNCIKLTLLGKTNIIQAIDTAYEREIERHNKEVDNNRYVLSKIIEVIMICGNCELALRGHDESAESLKPGIFRTIFEAFCGCDPKLKHYYEQSPIFKGTSKIIQNELLHCMNEIYREYIKNEISEAAFVSIEADETTDASCTSQMVTILRYLLPDDSIVERFIEFSEVKDKSALGLSQVIKCLLSELGVAKDKLIAQSYDGAAVMSGNVRGVQTQVKQEYPNAHFVHCYAHKLNLILQQVCSNQISDLKFFFAHLSGIPTFFSNSPKRMDALQEVCDRRMPRPSATRWNFKGRTVNAIHENLDELRQCMNNMQTQPGWDTITIKESYGILALLNDEKFLCYLEFFSILMPEIDILYSKFQKRNVDGVILHSAISTFKQKVIAIRERTDEIASIAYSTSNDTEDDFTLTRGRKMNKVCSSSRSHVMKEACDTIVAHVQDRFAQNDHLIAAKLIDITNFKSYNLKFPEELVNITTSYYPMLNKARLKTELKSLYNHEELLKDVTSAITLLHSFSTHALKNIFQETTKLIQIIITTPMTTAEAERSFSALKRIKTYLRTTMKQDRLNALSILSIEKQLLSCIPDFTNKVIEKFANMKDRRVSFHYKVSTKVSSQSQPSTSRLDSC